MSRNLRISVHNATGQPRIVRLEPWGREFSLDLDEKLDVIARTGVGPSLRVFEAIGTTLIYTEGCDTLCVVRDEVVHVLEARAEDDPPVPAPVGEPNPMWDRHLDG